MYKISQLINLYSFFNIQIKGQNILHICYVTYSYFIKRKITNLHFHGKFKGHDFHLFGELDISLIM